MGAVTDYLNDAKPEQVKELSHLTEEQKEAFLQVVGIAVYADGVASVEELEMTLDLIREIPAFAAATDQQLNILLARALVRLRKLADPVQANNEYLRLAAQLNDQQLREAAFGLAAVICLADGVVVQTEQNVLKRLIVAFDLPKERVVRTINKAKAFITDAP